MRLITLVLFGVLLHIRPTVGQVHAPTPRPDRIILNLTTEPATSVAVTWRSDTTMAEGFCEVQPATSGRIDTGAAVRFPAKTTWHLYSREGEPDIVAHQNSVVIDKLTPGTQYIYRVGNAREKSEWFDFETAPARFEPFSFIYFGDPQTALLSEWSRVIRKAWSTCPRCQFMVYGGDIINRAGRDVEWDEWFKAGAFIPAIIPQVLTPGNHDYKDAVLGAHWRAQFTQPENGPPGLEETCFAIDYPGLKLISIDSATGHELEDEEGYLLQAQKRWLDSTLRTNTSEWVILTTHLPFYSTKDSRDNPHMRKHFQPILEKYKVDLVLTGHDHSYGRGRASDNPEIKKPEVVYVVSVSGPKLNPAGTKNWMEKSGGETQLFQVISLDNTCLEYRSYTATGKLFDYFFIKRKASGKKKFLERKSATSE